MNRSYTITGLVISLLGFFLQQAGIEVKEEDLETFLTVLFAFVQLGGIILAYFGRWRKGDITLSGKYKNDGKSN